MRVLYVTNQPAPYKIDFFARLSEKVDLTVAYERRRAIDRDDRWYGESGAKFAEIYPRGLKVGSDTSCSLGVVRLLRKRKFDAVVMNGFSSPTAILTILYMICHKIPYGIMCDGMLEHRENRLKSTLKRRLISNASYCLSSNAATSDLLEGFGAKPERIHRYGFTSVSAGDVESASHDKFDYKKQIGFADEKIILYVGQFIERKGIDVLLRAFEMLKSDARLILVGGTTTSLEGLCGMSNNRVTVVDFLPKAELTLYYRAADVFVLPTRYDIWGLVVNEALSNALPVVTTDKCGAGLAMVRDGENGFVVPTDDSAGLAEKLDIALKNCDIMRESALETAREYTIETMAERTFDILRRVTRDER